MGLMEAIGQVAVIGAGTMGGGIAQLAASVGHEVHLVDAVDGAAEAAHVRVAVALAQLVARGRLTQEDSAAILGRVHVAHGLEDLPECGLVIEAVQEDLDVKRRLFAELAAQQPSTTILASNTSSLDIGAIAAAVHDPERVLGLHFFNPPPVMKLVEVVHSDLSAGPVLDHVARLMRVWGKTPVHCSSTPGFIVNRVARPFYGESQRMLEASVADAATLDACLRGAGFRMGPLELSDLIGQDVNLAVGTSVWEQTGRDERYTPTSLQQQLVADGHLGRKTGQGIYRYAGDGRPLEASPDGQRVSELVGGPILTDPVARTLAMLVNEAVDLVHRGEASAEDVDVAMTLGTNYPKGPIAWGEEIGHDVILEQLSALDAAFPGGRYRANQALVDGS